MQFFEFIINNWELFLALILILALLSRGSGAGVEPSEAIRMINHDKAVVVDVREDNEVAEGTIVNAIHIPLGKLADRLQELETYKAKPIIVNCRSGHRSAQACKTLRKNGFESVHNLKGGIMAWQNASLPLNKK